MVQDHFWNSAFLTHFRPIFGLETAHFQGILGFLRPKTRHHGLKTGQKHFFEHPKWSRNNFEKNHFFRTEHPGGPTIGPNYARAVPPSGYTK